MTALAAVWFGFLALLAAIGLLALAPRWEPGQWLLPAARTLALVLAAAAYTAWLFTL
jgi:hypothetical protein